MSNPVAIALLNIYFYDIWYRYYCYCCSCAPCYGTFIIIDIKGKPSLKHILHIKHGVDMESIVCLTGINRINIVHIYCLQKPWQKQCSFIDIWPQFVIFFNVKLLLISFIQAQCIWIHVIIHCCWQWPPSSSALTTRLSGRGQLSIPPWRRE